MMWVIVRASVWSAEFKHDDKICASLCRLGVVLQTVSIVCRFVHTIQSPCCDQITNSTTPLIYSLINILIFSKFYLQSQHMIYILHKLIYINYHPNPMRFIVLTLWKQTECLCCCWSSSRGVPARHVGLSHFISRGLLGKIPAGKWILGDGKPRGNGSEHWAVLSAVFRIYR